MEFLSEYRNSTSHDSSGVNSSSDSGSLFESFASCLQEVMNTQSPGSLNTITDGDRSSWESQVCQRRAEDCGNAVPVDHGDEQVLQMQMDCYKVSGCVAPFQGTEPHDYGVVSNMNAGGATTTTSMACGSKPNTTSRWSHGSNTSSVLGSLAPPTSARLSVDRGSAKGRKKRSRASKRVPTTILKIDASNFKAMVQQFTGIATDSFESANFSSNSGGSNRSPPGNIFPKPFPHAALAARTNSSRCFTTADADPSAISTSPCNNFSPTLIAPSLNPLHSLHDAYINPFLQSPDHHNFFLNINDKLSPNDHFSIYEEQLQQPMADYINTSFLEDLGLDYPISWRNI